MIGKLVFFLMIVTYVMKGNDIYPEVMTYDGPLTPKFNTATWSFLKFDM